MKKLLLAMAFSLVLLFGLAMNALAFDVFKTVADPNYMVTSVSGHDVKEDYNAKSLVLFPSHDGYAVVDLYLPGIPIWFDKVLLFNADDVKDKNFEITWTITNTSPYTWSDYHFLFDDEGQVIKKAQSADFKGVTIVGNTEIDYFYSGSGSKFIAPGDALHVNFTFNLTGLDALGGDIECRQIATAVPIPAALPLFGSGLLGLGLLGWRRR